MLVATLHVRCFRGSSTDEAERYVAAVDNVTKEVPACLMEIADLDKKGKTLSDGVRTLPYSFVQHADLFQHMRT